MAEFDVSEITKLYNDASQGVEEQSSMPQVYDPGYYTPYSAITQQQKEEQANKDWKAAKAVYNGVAGVGRGVLNAALMVRELGIQRAKEENPEYEETKATGEVLNATLNSSALQRYDVKGDTALGQLGLDLAEGAGQLAAQMGVTALTGGTGGAVFMGAQIAGNQYEVLRKSGVGVERASQAAVANGIIQGIMEKMGLEKVMKALPANSPLKKKLLGYVESFVSEGLTEGLQNIPDQLTEIWAKNEGASAQEIARIWDESAPENLKAMGYDALIGGLLGVGGRAANNAVNTAVEGVGKIVHEHQVTQLEKRIENAKAQGLAPEEIAFNTNESMPDDYVFVDADMLQTFMQTKNAQEVAETLGVSEEEIAAAVELGNDVTVRLGDYEAAAVKYNDLHSELKDGISFGGADESTNNVQRREELRKEYQDLDAETKNQLNSEIDKIMQSAETAGINQNVREGLRSILLSRAMIWDADHPANFFKEHPITFSNQGMVDNGKGAYFQTAYHGSPYNFNAFNLQAIGTGEGAQAHGYGLYFALDDEVAKGYKEKLTEVNKNPVQYKVGNSSFSMSYYADSVTVNGEDISGDESIAQALRDLHFHNKPNSGKVSLKDALAKAEKVAAVWAEDASKTDKRGVHEQAEMYAHVVEGYKKLLAQGEEIELSQENLSPTLYKVDVPELDTMLDEEGYFDEQPEIVQNAVLAILDSDVSDLTGRQIYKKLVKQLGSKKAASLALKEHGVQGIFYDGRQDGDCVVVFDDEAIKILDKYQDDVDRRYYQKKQKYVSPDELKAIQSLQKDSEAFGKLMDAWDADRDAWEKKHNGDLYDFLQMPMVLETIGLPRMKLQMYGSFFSHAIRPAHPGMSKEVLKKIPHAITNPILIMKGDKANSYVVVVEVKDNVGATVVVPLEINKYDNNHGIISVVNSAFGKTTNNKEQTPNYSWFVKNLGYDEATKKYNPQNNNLMYINRKKSNRWIEAIRSDSPVGPAILNAALFGNSIKDETDFVNHKKDNPGYYQESSDEAKGAIQFSQDGAAVINLFKGADASTVIHETGHYFVEAMARDIENGIANEQQIKDFEALLKYSDLDMDRWNSIREQLRTGNLSDEEKEALQAEVTKVHERLAEAFESYIIEGKAPKRELRHVFNRFAKWLRAVYSSVRQNAQGEEVKEYDPANRNTNAVALTKEVTDVFDRWLAAEEDIAAQETIDGFFAQIPESARNFLSEKSQEQIKDYIARAHDEAINILTKTYMLNFGKDRAAKIAAYKKNARAQAEEAVRNRPLYTAMQMLAEYTDVGKQAPKTIARKYLRSLNNNALDRKEELQNIKADIAERLDPIVEQLEAGIGEERTYWVDKETGKETDVSDLEKNKAEELKTKRFYDQVTEDTSADWYRNYKQKYGKRKLSKKRLREIAYEIYTGNDEFGLYASDMFGMSTEDAEAFKQEAQQNKAEIDTLMERQKYLENVAEIRKPFGWDKADVRFTLAESDRVTFDAIAENCGFHTGEELAKAIQDGDTFGQAVNKELESMVDKVFPDYYKDAELRKDAIREALYNDKTGQVIALEQQLIEDYVAGVGARQRSNETKAKLAKLRKQNIKIIALNKIAQMPMRKLQNIRSFIRAERMAAAEAQRAIKNGDMEAAAMWKETQAVNHAIVVEAVKIKNQTKANVKTIARIRRMKREAFSTEQHFNQVAALLARMGQRVARKDYDPTTKTEDLREYVAEMASLYDNVAVAEWLLDENVDLSNAKDMTYEQYTDVMNTLKNLVAISQNERKKSKLDKERSMQETKAEVVSELSKLKDNYKPGPNGKDDRSSAKYWMDRAVASLRNTDNLFELMDNWTYGYFSKTWGAALKRCADLEAELTMQMESDFRDAYAEWIEANPELKGNDRDVYYEELGTVANKATLIKMLINLGNDGNSRILCSTPPIDMKSSSLWVMADETTSQEAAVAQTKANLIKFLGEHLTASDIKFAKRQVAIASRNWPLLADVERRTKGFTPKKVEASPVSLTLADGTTEVFEGGYYPLVRDTREGSRPQNIDVFDIGADLPAANVKTMHTNTGASKARTQANYPISLAADSGMRSIRDVIHDIAYRETMADFRKLLNDKEVMPLLKQKLGVATTEQLGEMLIKTANPTGSRLAMAEDFYASAANWIRRKTVNAAIMLNLKTAFQNVGNITLYARVVEGFGYDDVGRAIFGRGLLQAANWKGNTELDMLCSKSVFMRERVLFPDYTIKEIMGEENLTPVQRKTMKWGAMVLAYTDNLTAKPVWAEAYRKKIAEGATEQEAIDFADLIIRRVLGSNRTQDVSSFMRGGPIYKLFTSFQGFFNTQFNQWEREANIARNFASEGEYKKAVERITAFAMSKWLLNCMMALMLGIENPFKRDDKDGYLNLTKEMMHYPLSMCGPIGQATNMFMDNAFGISSYRFRLSAIESTLDKGGKLMRAVNRVYSGKDDASALIEPAMGVALPLAFDVPDQVNKLLWNAWDILYNDMSPEFSDLVRRRPKNERK